MAKAMLLAGIILSVMLPAGGLSAQEEGGDRQPPPTHQEISARFLVGVEKKLVTMAEEFPEELWEYRPHEDSRNFGETIMHVALTNQQAALAAVEGRQPNIRDYAFTTKADAVAKLKQSFANARKGIQEHYVEEWYINWFYVIAHSEEHYGILVVYYRANGLVPPASR